MTLDEFRLAFRDEINQVVSCIQRRYNITDEELAGALHASARKYLPDIVSGSGASVTNSARKAVGELLSSLNFQDMCLAIACAKGDDPAWEEFFREYRSYLAGIARTMTSDAGAAEQLADSTFAELYGLRESGGARVSKFSFYSGRGSLKGWLRAVVYQLAADSHRQTSRFIQTEEPEDMDRLAHSVAPAGTKIEFAEFESVNRRYRAAVADALRLALGQLEPRERLLLTYYYYDDMTLREIGQLFAVHEATVSRWLSKVQKRARKLVEKCLAREHGFKRREVTEAVELAGRKLDIDVRDYLFEAVAADRETDAAAEGAGGAAAPR
jgi:RNA polymerase sigma-70 factor (ECF subfamily)